MELLRDFTNRAGVTFDGSKTYILYAEDLLDIKENFNLVFNSALRFLSSSVIAYRTGLYYDQSIGTTNVSFLSGVANRMEAVPFYCSKNITLATLGVAIVTAVPGTTAKIAIYESASDGLPSDLLYGGGDISTGSTGYQSESVSVSLIAGRTYWFAVRTSGNPAIRAVARPSFPSLGLLTADSTSYASVFRKTITYASSWESSNPFSVSDLIASSTQYSVRFSVS